MRKGTDPKAAKYGWLWVTQFLKYGKMLVKNCNFSPSSRAFGTFIGVSLRNLVGKDYSP